MASIYVPLKNYNEVYQSDIVPCTKPPLSIFVNEKGLWTTIPFSIKQYEKTKTKKWK